MTIATWRVLVLGVAVCLLLGSLGGCRPANSPATSVAVPNRIDLLAAPTVSPVRESWDAYFLGDAKVEHRHTAVYPQTADGEELIHTRVVDQLELKRYGQHVQQQLITASLETPAGRIRQLAWQLDNGSSVARGEGTVQQGTLIIERVEADHRSTRRYRWPEDSGGTFAIEQSLAREPMEVGQQRVVRLFLPLLERVAEIRLTAQRFESVPLRDEEQRLLRIEVADRVEQQWLPSRTLWCDEKGDVLKAFDPLMQRATIRVSRAEAQRPNDPVQRDLGWDVRVPLKQPIRDPHTTTLAVYRVHSRGLPPTAWLARDATQQVRPLDEQRALVTVRRVDLPADEHQKTPGEADLQANRWIQPNDPRVANLAQSAVGSLNDPRMKAIVLEQYIHRTLDRTDFSRVFESSAEVAVSRRGDCSEHAVLLAAACRAQGIPARLAIGLIYSDQEQAFLYHMWNEVWIGDRWLSLDATLGQRGIGAAHIKFRDSSLAGETPYSLIGPMVHMIGQIEIQLESVSYD